MDPIAPSIAPSPPIGILDDLDNLNLSSSSDDSIDSDDDDYVDPITLEEETMSSSEFLLKRLTTAEDKKKEANVCFIAKENEKARDLYRLGLKQLDYLKMKHLSSVDSELAVDKLRCALQNNLAAVYNRMEVWEASIKASTAVLEKDPTSSKALFRRAYAHFHRSVTGAYLQEAKKDLVLCLKQDIKNKSARKLFKQLKAKVALQKEEQMKSLSGMFDGKSLYSDIDEKKAIKLKEEKKQKKLIKEKEKSLWRIECERRIQEGEDELDFEAYRRVLKKEREEKERIKDEKRKQEKKERRKRQKERDAEDFKVVVEDDDDEEGLQKGYKKTKDGRTTSYFTRELDDGAKKLLEAQGLTPQKIISTGETKVEQIKNWNETGVTWVDKDISKFATDQLKRIRTNIEIAGIAIEVTSIEVEEDGCKATRVSKNKGVAHMFECNFKAKWTAKWGEGESGTCNGYLKVVDFNDNSKELDTKSSYELVEDEASLQIRVQAAVQSLKASLFTELTTTYIASLQEKNSN